MFYGSGLAHPARSEALLSSVMNKFPFIASPPTMEFIRLFWFILIVNVSYRCRLLAGNGHAIIQELD